MKRIGIVDTTLRDAQQCLWATRMTTPMMLPIAERLDRVGFDAIEVMGAVHFDASVRYLGENPWERLRLLRARMERTPMQALLRSKCVLGFDLVPDDLSALWAERLVTNGIKRFVAFDGLHDLNNLSAAVARAKEMGAFTIGWLTYSDSPVHTDELYVGKAREFLDKTGVDALMIEDASGVLVPERAARLTRAIKAEIGDVSLGLHSHGLIGLCQRSYLEAVREGVENVYTAIPPLADANAPPSILTTAHNLAHSGFDVDVDIALIEEIATFIDALADITGKPKGAPRDFDAAFMGHQIPGGVHSNLQAQLEAAGLGDKFPAVLEESARVRSDLGWPIQVTPFAQLIGVQATFNVVRDERYAVVPAEIKKYVLGYYGKLLAPVDADVLDRIISNGPKTVALTPPQLDPVVADLRKRLPNADDDERILRYFFDPGLVDVAMRDRVNVDEFAVLQKPLTYLLSEMAKRSKNTSITVQKAGLHLEVRGGQA